MRRADRLTGVLLLAFALYTLISGWGMGYWQGRIPGPGFAPIWIAAGLMICGVLLALRRGGPPAAQGEVPDATRPRPRGLDPELILAGKIAALTVIAVFLIKYVGMLAGVALLLLVLIRLLGGPWRSAMVTTLVMSAVFYAVFVRWLAVPVPKGPWGF